jgi:maleate isomerase
MSSARVLLGILTPSSNTRLEPLTSRMLAPLDEVSAHFSRFRVVDVGLAAAGQFDLEVILSAAELLADARVDSIAWSGTSGGWRGIEADRELCIAITERTGIPATTSTLALLEAAKLTNASSLGLVTPYPDDMHKVVAKTLTGAGLKTTVDRNHAVTQSSWELSEISVETLTRLVSQLVVARPDVICTFCTNLAAAGEVEQWEKSWGVPIYDTVSLAVWGALRLAGVDTGRVTGWGRLFQLR